MFGRIASYIKYSGIAYGCPSIAYSLPIKLDIFPSLWLNKAVAVRIEDSE